MDDMYIVKLITYIVIAVILLAVICTWTGLGVGTVIVGIFFAILFSAFRR